MVARPAKVFGGWRALVAVAASVGALALSGCGDGLPAARDGAAGRGAGPMPTRAAPGARGGDRKRRWRRGRSAVRGRGGRHAGRRAGTPTGCATSSRRSSPRRLRQTVGDCANPAGSSRVILKPGVTYVTAKTLRFASAGQQTDSRSGSPTGSPAPRPSPPLPTGRSTPAIPRQLPGLFDRELDVDGRAGTTSR